MNLRLGPRLRPAFTPPAERDLPLEGLRGICALAVFYAHVFVPGPATDPEWAPSARFWHFNLGAPAVLMFFVLSGYVIGLVTSQPATSANIRTYGRHRLARLVPLNTAAVLTAWLFLPTIGGRALLGNLLFLENDQAYPLLGTFPLLPDNTNLWSLNYEAVYYVGFIALWALAPSALLTFTSMALLVVGHSMGLPVPAIFARYACGALYWLAGLAIAWRARPVPTEARHTNWPAAMLGFLAMWQVGPLRGFLYDANLHGWLWTTPVSPHRLDLLAAGVWVLLAVTGRAPALRRILTFACLLLITAALLAHAFRHDWEEVHSIAAIATGFAWVLGHREISVSALRRCAPLGVISFGLYVIASPLQIGQRAVWTEFSGTWVTFTVRAVALTALAFTAAWFLERWLSPPLSRWLRGSRRAADASAGSAAGIGREPCLRPSARLERLKK